jgi:hypothetical protein
MPTLSNAKHERFAQLLAKGRAQAEAYAEVGYAPSEPHASRLASSGKVAARVAEILDHGATRAAITLESHLNDLAALRDAARRAKQYSAAIAAEIARGKASGVHVEKSEQMVTTRELPASVDEFV